MLQKTIIDGFFYRYKNTLHAYVIDMFYSPESSTMGMQIKKFEIDNEKKLYEKFKSLNLKKMKNNTIIYFIEMGTLVEDNPITHWTSFEFNKEPSEIFSDNYVDPIFLEYFMFARQTLYEMLLDEKSIVWH